MLSVGRVISLPLPTSHREPALSLQGATALDSSRPGSYHRAVPPGCPEEAPMRIRLVLVLLGLILSSPCPALAVPIDVGGSLAFGVGGGGGPDVNLVGTTRGFTVNGFTDEVGPFFGPFGGGPCE